MSKFDAAFNYMIQYEGEEFVDDPDDEGGATKFGISYKFVISLITKGYWLQLPGTIPEMNANTWLSQLKLDQAKIIYKKYFWMPVYDQIEDQNICNYVFDMAVNHGHNNAHIILQRACRSCGKSIKEDGVLGPITLAAINYYANGHNPEKKFINEALKSERAGFMRCIVVKNPSQKKYLGGWLKRAYGERL